MSSVSAASGAFLLRQLGTTPPSKLVAPVLPEGITEVAAIPGDWFAVHSRIDGGSRDAAVAWAFFLAGLPFYYPVGVDEVYEGRGKFRQKRTKRVSYFDGYLFAAGAPAKKFCRDNPDLIECTLAEPRIGMLREELIMAEAALKHDPRTKTRDVSMPGALVRVTRGKWQGKEGIVELPSDQTGNLPETQVWVKSELMNCRMAIPADTSDLELC